MRVSVSSSGALSSRPETNCELTLPGSDAAPPLSGPLTVNGSFGYRMPSGTSPCIVQP